MRRSNLVDLSLCVPLFACLGIRKNFVFLKAQITFFFLDPPFLYFDVRFRERHYADRMRGSCWLQDLSAALRALTICF